MRFNGGDDLVKIADSASYLTPISEIDRARKYPYHAPSGGFVLSNGDLFHLNESHLSHDPKDGILAGRTAVYQLGLIGRRCNCFGNLAGGPPCR